MQRAVEDKREANDETLASFNTINTGENVNCIGAKDSQHAHVNVEERTYHGKGFSVRHTPTAATHFHVTVPCWAIPRFKDEPSRPRNGKGTMTLVEPKLTMYTISSGSDAIVGSTSLWLAFVSQRKRDASAKV